MKKVLFLKYKAMQLMFPSIALFFGFTSVSPGLAVAISQSELHSIYNDSVWYKIGQSTPDDSLFCLGGPGGSGPLYGPFFPKVADTATLAQYIKDYISTTRPDSPLINLASAYVGYGQQYNVNPVLVLAITQKETSLGTAGYANPPKYNVGNIRGDSGDGTGFNSYSGYQDGLKAIFELISGPLYLGPPSNDTTIAQVMRTYAPPSDNNDTVGYIKFIMDIMKRILGSLPEGSDPANNLCTPGSSPPGTVNTDGYAFPVGPQTKSAGYNLPCGKFTCHWDGSPAADIIRPNIDGAPVYAITDGEIGRVNPAYGGVPGCSSINLASSLDGYQYWYGHLQNPLVRQGDIVRAGQKIAEVARSSFGSRCWGGTPHLHIDRGCIVNGIKQPGGYENCRDPGLVTLIDKLWSELPN